jgi:pentatricopeptide repeat protein
LNLKRIHTSLFFCSYFTFLIHFFLEMIFILFILVFPEGMMQQLHKWQEKGFTPTETTYTHVIQHNLRKGDYVAALHVCDDMKARAHDPALLAQVFNARMLVHSTRGDVAACTQELSQMDAQGVSRDEGTYLNLLKAHVRAGDLASARTVLAEMLAGGFVVDSAAHCVLLSAYAQKGDLPTCAQLVEEMRAQGMYPNAHTYAQWIDALCEAQDINGALRALDEMKEVEKNIPLATWAKMLEKGWKEKKTRGKIYERIKLWVCVAPILLRNTVRFNQAL